MRCSYCGSMRPGHFHTVQELVLFHRILLRDEKVSEEDIWLEIIRSVVLSVPVRTARLLPHASPVPAALTQPVTPHSFIRLPRPSIPTSFPPPAIFPPGMLIL